MSDGKEVKLRTKPPRNCQYLTWCNDCDEAVPHEEGSCAGCESLDLVYFVKESDHLAAMAELRAEVERYRLLYEDYSSEVEELQHERRQLENTIATQARVIEDVKSALNNHATRPSDALIQIREAIEKEGAKDE